VEVGGVRQRIAQRGRVQVRVGALVQVRVGDNGECEAAAGGALGVEVVCLTRREVTVPGAGSQAVAVGRVGRESAQGDLHRLVCG